MGTITGSTNVNWSTIPFDPVNFEADILLLRNRMTAALSAFINEQFTVVQVVPFSLLVVRLNSGEFLTLTGTNVLVAIESIGLNAGLQTLNMSGYMDGIGNTETLTSLSIAHPSGVYEEIRGNFTLNAFSGAFLGGSISELSISRGAYTTTIAGDLAVTGGGNITGTITTLRISNGANEIQMTGLDLPFDPTLASITNASTLLSVIGGRLTGDDTVTYANNSTVGLAFLSGDGNDSITVSGPNGDTLNGGAGTDTLAGGLGNDNYVYDGTDDDFVENPGEGTDTILASATYTLPDASENVENVILTGTGAIGATGNGGANVLTGNSGANVLDGLADDDTLLGGLGNDQLNGGAGNDSLVGAAGADTMIGGTENDTYTLDTAADVVTELDEPGSDTARITYNVAVATTIDLGTTYGGFIENVQILGTGVFNLTGNSAVNALTGNAFNNTLRGGGENDILTGNAGNDVLNGEAGNDAMAGGTGNDTYDVDSNDDEISEAAGAAGGIDLVRSTAETFTLDTNVENLLLLEGANGTGNAIANVITGNGGDNVLDGKGGNDRLTGGMGDDTYVVDAPLDVVVEGLNGGADTVQSFITYSIAAQSHLEHVTLMGEANINAIGNAQANTLNGNSGNNALNGGAGSDNMAGGAGNDMLDGGLGNDTMTGGAGDDTFKVDTHPQTGELDSVVEADGMAGGMDRVIISFNNAGSVLQLFAGEGILFNVEHVTVTGTGLYDIGEDQAGVNMFVGNASVNVLTGGTGNDTLVGNGGNDTLNGGADGDSLDGGLGVDSMTGGDGNDAYTVDTAADVVVELAAGGSDTVKITYNVSATAITHVDLSVPSTLGGNIEHVQVTGAGRFNLTGNEDSNSLTGNAANNVLLGGDGSDTLMGGAGADTLDGGAGIDGDVMDGGAGNDLYKVDNPVDSASEAVGGVAGGVDTVHLFAQGFTLGANVENLVLMSDSQNGTGNNLANVITGNAGDNILDGGSGNDRLIGGLGNDTYIVDAPLDVIVEAAGGGTDTVQSFIHYSIALQPQLEHVTLLGSANVNATGNALANTLIGNSGNNVLNGGAGNDTMIGGDGNDTYVFSGTGDLLTEILGEGNDTLQLSFNTSAPLEFSLESPAYDNVENVRAVGTGNFNLTGDAENNALIGNASYNSLEGGAGDDTLIGGAGGDSLNGGEGNDRLDGGGGPGLNSLSGGSGTDSFVFSALPTPGGLGGNDVFDFATGTDKVLLDNDIFVGLAVGALNPAAFKVLSIMSDPIDASDRIIYVNDGGGHLWYDANGSVGGSNFVPIATFFSSPALTAADFLVID
jgi:trimeric autotransporter adhesin